jgi:hypothetical protein
LPLVLPSKGLRDNSSSSLDFNLLAIDPLKLDGSEDEEIVLENISSRGNDAVVSLLWVTLSCLLIVP